MAYERRDDEAVVEGRALATIFFEVCVDLSPHDALRVDFVYLRALAAEDSMANRLSRD